MLGTETTFREWAGFFVDLPQSETLEDMPVVARKMSAGDRLLVFDRDDVAPRDSRDVREDRSAVAVYVFENRHRKDQIVGVVGQARENRLHGAAMELRIPSELGKSLAKKRKGIFGDLYRGELSETSLLEKTQVASGVATELENPRVGRSELFDQFDEKDASRMNRGIEVGLGGVLGSGAPPVCVEIIPRAGRMAPTAKALSDSSQPRF